MTFLFGSNMSFRKKLKVIAKLAAEHASNLAAFACLYKVSTRILYIECSWWMMCISAGGTSVGYVHFHPSHYIHMSAFLYYSYHLFDS